MIALKNCVIGKTMMLPTEFNELDAEYFTNCVKGIAIAPHHCIVALVYKEKLSKLMSASKAPTGHNQTNSIVYPVLAKHDVDSNMANMGASVGDKLIVSGSDLGRAYHVNANCNKLSIDNVIKFINGDKELLKSCSLNGEISKTLLITGAYNFFVEFKLIPTCDVKGVYHYNDYKCVYVYNSVEKPQSCDDVCNGKSAGTRNVDREVSCDHNPTYSDPCYGYGINKDQ